MLKPRQIKKRIKGVENIQQITKAMKLVAAVKIKPKEKELKSLLPYQEEIERILYRLLLKEEVRSPFLISPETGDVAIIVVAGDKGLCGAFNYNILRRAFDFIKSSDGKVKVYPVGIKAVKAFGKLAEKIPAVAGSLSELANYNSALKIVDYFIEQFLLKKIKELRVIYGGFISTMEQRVKEEQLLSIKKPVSTKFYTDFILIEPSIEVFLERLIRKYLQQKLFKIMIETATAELGARLIAMTEATDNAEEVISQLALQFYRARQESITTEIVEIATGAEAIKMAGGV